jgi:lactoylglutathione lyase
MGHEKNKKLNIKETVPFFLVSDIEASLGFYVTGLGFEIKNKWIPREKIEWCALQRDAAALMLQEPRKDKHHPGLPEGKLGVGISIVFICEDALAIYEEINSKGIKTSVPFVGNNMWVVSLQDPDGYRIDFESLTDVPEGTEYNESFKSSI